jgi:urocanate hydratase
MTAGSYCYIGPQGIVHGTTLTILNAARKYLDLPDDDLTGKIYLSSGLGKKGVTSISRSSAM